MGSADVFAENVFGVGVRYQCIGTGFLDVYVLFAVRPGRNILSLKNET